MQMQRGTPRPPGPNSLHSSPFFGIRAAQSRFTDKRTLQKLIVIQLVKKFPVFYGTLRFIAVFTTARH